MTSFEFLSNVCIPQYYKLIPWFNGNMQWKSPEYLGQREEMQMKTTLWHIVLDGQKALKVWWGLLKNCGRSLCLEFCLASIFPIKAGSNQIMVLFVSCGSFSVNFRV